MHAQVATKLVVTNGTSELSQAISMAGGNAVEVEATLYSKGGGNFDIQVQEGNDLQNWSDVGSPVEMASEGASSAQISAVAGQYVRLKFTQNVDGVGVVAAGINVTNL